MKCPQCVQQNERSCCFQGNRTSSTAMGGVQRYWDEGGVYHNHNPNRSTGYFHCSRGHRWIVISRNPCPGCAWGHEDPQVTIRESRA